MPSGLTSCHVRPPSLVMACPAGLALDCVSSPTGTGAVPVPSNPAGSTAGVNRTASFVATRCDSAPANPVTPPQATRSRDSAGRAPAEEWVSTGGRPLHVGDGLAGAA